MTNSTDSMQARKANSSFTQVGDNEFKEILTPGEKAVLSALRNMDDVTIHEKVPVFDFVESAAAMHLMKDEAEDLGLFFAVKEKGGDPFDIQVGGSHYRECEIQPGQYILANGIGFFEGCMIKRLTRYNRATGKGLEDLRKVRHEIDILIAEVERNGIRKPQQRE